MGPWYGQVVVGPPGSGKTTYCNGMQQYLRLLGRNASVINLDPANEIGAGVGILGDESLPQNKNNTKKTSENENSESLLPYDTTFDICEEVVNLSSVMKQLDLGPNGGLVYCMEYLESHIDDIIQMIRDRCNSSDNSGGDTTKRPYLIIDLPGQVELYTHSTCVQMILQRLVKELDLRLTAIQLIDAQYCTDATKFISAALLGTTTMIRLELPTVNVLSKVDLLVKYGDLPFSLEFFTDCYELHRLVPLIDTSLFSGAEANNNKQNNNSENDHDYYDEFDNMDYTDDPEYIKARQKTRQSTFFQKREKLHKALAEVVEDFGLLSFIPLDISNAESVGRVLAKVDKCNGYVFTESSFAEDMFQCAIQSDNYSNTMHIADIEERLAFERESSSRPPPKNNNY